MANRVAAIAVGFVVAFAGCPRRQDNPRAQRAHAPHDAGVEEQCNPRYRNACGDDDTLVACNADGTFGSVVKQCENGCRRGACAETCATQGVELVYLVDDRNHFLSFDPTALPDGDPFHPIGTLDCEAGSGGSPFSMAVNRKGIAWVLYTSGLLYRVNIVDGHCTRPGLQPGPDAPYVFGMGFSTNGAAGGETLYATDAVTGNTLASIDTTSVPPRWTPIARITPGQSQNPELTGTGDAKLFGYFPGPGRGFVQELDKASGQLLGARHELGGTGNVQAYAFAHWGGVFYVFASDQSTSSVYSVRRKTGEFAVVRAQIPYRIVGAGVSTCAPELERVDVLPTPATPHP